MNWTELCHPLPSEDSSCRPDVGDIDLLAEFLKDIIFNCIEGILQLSDVRTVTLQLTSQITDHQLYQISNINTWKINT